MKGELYLTSDGITVIYSPVKNISGVQFDLNFQAGALNDPIGKAGLAHFCEHILMACSTRRFTREEKNREMGKYQYINAFTSNYNLCMVISALNDDIAEAVDSMTESFDGIKLTQEEFDIEKRIIQDEIITRKKDNVQLLDLIINKKLEKTPQFNNREYSAAGSLEMLDNITIQDVQKYLRDYITKENLTISVAGNITKKQVDSIIEKYISPRLPAAGKKGFSRNQQQGYKEPQFLYSKSMESGQSFINIFYKLSNNAAVKYFDRRLEHRNSIISNVLNKLAFLYFREKYNLCYSLYLGIYQDSTSNDVIDFALECQDENLEKVLKVYNDFICDISGKFDIDLFEKAKKKVYGYTNFDVKSIKKISSDRYQELVRFGDVLCEHELETNRQLIDSISYAECKAALDRLAGVKPYVIIISDNEKIAKFDYDKFVKKQK